jgi:hypothetical protein
MATLATVMLNAARILTEVRNGTATGGSTTTLADSTCTDPDDFYNGGIIWFLSGNNSGKTATVTDFASSTGTWTFAAQSGACASGNLYAVMRGMYTRDDLKTAVNSVLAELGEVIQINSALIPVSNQLSYSLPAWVKGVRRVELVTSGVPEISFFWKEINGNLYFDSGHEPTSDQTVNLIYAGEHAAVQADSDTVSDYIDASYLAWATAFYAALKRSERDNNKYIKEIIGLAQGKMSELSRKAKINFPRDAHLAGW